MIYLFCSVDVINMQDSFVIIFHYVGNCEICLHYWVQMSILEHFAFRGEKWSWYSDHLVTFCHRQTKYNAHIFHTCHIKSPLLTLHSILTISIISTEFLTYCHIPIEIELLSTLVLVQWTNVGFCWSYII